LAQQRAEDGGLPVMYVATARILDDEMAARIALHQDGRPESWALIEEPLSLANVLNDYAGPNQCLLIDCLTLWLSNLLAEGGDTLEFQKRALLTTLPEMPGHIILVSNETGLGIVPADPLSRHFRDEAGRLHQELAQLCDRVTLTVAGLPLTLKDALI
jgi:adenosylcobinamide kinase/adenosylcobinamide-phosphate guanylyltransferase